MLSIGANKPPAIAGVLRRKPHCYFVVAGGDVFTGQDVPKVAVFGDEHARADRSAAGGLRDVITDKTRESI